MYKGQATKQDATINAYDVSGPIPISRGTNKLTLTYIESPWNYTVDDEGSKRSDSYWYSLAGLLQWGPVSKITGIFSNGSLVNSSNISLSSDSTSLTHLWGDLGMRMRIHKGTPTQGVDPRLNGIHGTDLVAAGVKFIMNPAPNIHPNYRDLCYVVFDTYGTAWSSNSSTTGSSHISDILFRTFTLNDSINPGGETERRGVNPIGLIYDLLKSKTYGLGLPDERVSLSAWTNAALDFYHQRSTSDYISPLIDSKSDVENVLSDLLDYYHGYLPRSGRAITPTWLNMNSAVDTSTIPTIKSTDFSEDPTVTDGDMSTTFTSMELKCKDFDDDLGDASMMVRSPYGYFLTPEAKTSSRTISNIHDVSQALEWGNRELKLFTRPTLTVEGPVPREISRRLDGSPLKIGDLCNYSDDIADSQYVCQVLEQTDSLDKGVSLKLVEVPGQWPEQQSLGTDPRENPPENLPDDIVYVRPWMIPSALRSGAESELAMLIERPDYCQYAEIYISEQSLFTGEEQQLDDISAFSSRGMLSEPVGISIAEFTESTSFSRIILASDDNFYATNSNDNSIYKITQAGVVTLFVSGLDGPFGICQASDGNLYVTNNPIDSSLGEGTISMITLAGVISTFATGLPFPFGICQASDGNFYVTNSNGSISKVTSAGIISNLVSVDDMTFGICEGPDGYLYVTGAYTTNISIRKIDLSGTVIDFAIGLDAPDDIFFSTDGFFYITDMMSPIITKVDIYGEASIYSTLSEDASGICKGVDGNIYITGYSSTNIRVLYDNSSSATFEFGTANLSRSFSSAEISDGYMFIIVDDEAMILGELQSSTETTITYSVTRGAFGTTQTGHDSGSEIWIIEKSLMQRYTHTIISTPPTIAWAKAIPVGTYGSGNPTEALMITEGDVTVLTDNTGTVLTFNGYTITPNT